MFFFFQGLFIIVQSLFLILLSGSQDSVRFLRPVARQNSGSCTLRMIVKVAYLQIEIFSAYYSYQTSRTSGFMSCRLASFPFGSAGLMVIAISIDALGSNLLTSLTLFVRSQKELRTLLSVQNRYSLVLKVKFCE